VKTGTRHGWADAGKPARRRLEEVVEMPTPVSSPNTRRRLHARGGVVSFELLFSVPQRLQIFIVGRTNYCHDGCHLQRPALRR